jgi:chromosome segregation ATPase
MRNDAGCESYSGGLGHSLLTSYGHIGSGSNGSSGSDSESQNEDQLKSAVSIASAQLGHDLRLVGSQLQSIETGHRSLMERLQRIAAQVDERVQLQFELLQRDGDGTRQQISTVREELEALRSSFPQKLQIIRDQCETFGREFQIADQRFKEIEQELRCAEDSAAQQNNTIEQRLRTAEPKILAAENNWRQTEEWCLGAEQRFTTIEQQLEEKLQAAAKRTVQLEEDWGRTDERLQASEARSNNTDEHLHVAVQRLQEVERQLTEAVSQIKILEPQISNYEERLQGNADLLLETRQAFDEQKQRRETIEVSLNALAHDLQRLKSEFAKLSDGRVENLQAMLGSNRRMQALAMLAWIMSLLLVGFLGIGIRGSSVLTQYLSQWVPGLFI